MQYAYVLRLEKYIYSENYNCQCGLLKPKQYYTAMPLLQLFPGLSYPSWCLKSNHRAYLLLSKAG